MSTPAPNPFEPGAGESSVMVSIETGTQGVRIYDTGTQSPAAATADPVTIGLTVDVYDVAGRHVKDLYDNAQVYQRVVNVKWDGTDHKGEPVATGIYFFRAQIGDEITSQKVLLLR
jgi:flagellar hook assembly protein FlgD